MTNPPPGWPPGWPPPPPPPPPPRRSGAETFGAAVVGVFIYFALNFVVALLVVVVLGQAQTVSSNLGVAMGAIALGVIAFGGGAALIMIRNPWTRGIGMGLMIGWALTSIVTVGFCTGLNPTLYGTSS